MENQEQAMTVKDVLTQVCDTLCNISIPAALIESIGIPVAKAINGVKVCLDAMNRPQEPTPENTIDLGEIGGEEDA